MKVTFAAKRHTVIMVMVVGDCCLDEGCCGTADAGIIVSDGTDGEDMQ